MVPHSSREMAEHLEAGVEGNLRLGNKGPLFHHRIQNKPE